MSKWLALVAQFAPMIFQLTGINPIIGSLVSDGIQAVETVMGASTGPSKKAAVLEGVTKEVTSLNQLRAQSGKPSLGDPTQVATSVGGVIDLVVTVVNAVHAAPVTNA